MKLLFLFLKKNRFVNALESRESSLSFRCLAEKRKMADVIIKQSKALYVLMKALEELALWEMKNFHELFFSSVPKRKL